MANHEFRSGHSSDGSQTVVAQEVDGRYISWLLVELEGELLRLPASMRESAFREAEDHVRSSCAALIELGLDQAEADKEAVRSFGSPQTFVDGLLHPSPSSARAVVWIAVLSFAYFAVVLSAFNMAMIWTGLIVSLLLLAWFSWRAKVYQWRRIAVTGAACIAIGALFMGLTWVSLWDAGGFGVSPRWQLAGLQRDLNADNEAIAKGMAKCDPIAALFNSRIPSTDTRIYRDGWYLTFLSHSPYPDSRDEGYELYWQKSYYDAARSWRQYKRDASTAWTRHSRETVQGVLACDQARRKVVDFTMLGQGATASLVFWSLALAVNFMASFLRSLYDLLRSKKRRQIA